MNRGLTMMLVGSIIYKAKLVVCDEIISLTVLLCLKSETKVVCIVEDIDIFDVILARVDLMQ